MTRCNRCSAVVTAVLVLAALTLPATAPADPPGCPGIYCLWTKSNYNGERLVVEKHKPLNMPGFMNNKASSMKSRISSNEALFLYGRKNGGGEISACSSGPGNFPFFGIEINDGISSTDVNWASTC